MSSSNRFFIEILADASLNLLAQRFRGDVCVADKIYLMNLDSFTLADFKRDLNRICIPIDGGVGFYRG